LQKVEAIRLILLSKRRFCITVIQILIVCAGYWSAFLLRFDFQIPPDKQVILFKTLPLLLVCRLSAYFLFRLNSGWWRFVSMQDLMNITKAIVLGTVLFLAGLVFVYSLGTNPFPRSLIISEALINFVLIGGIRFGVRWFREVFMKTKIKQRKYVLIVGAGKAGTQLLREIRINPIMGIDVVGFIDDDPFKKNIYFQGVKVLGACKDIPTLVKDLDIDEIFLSIPSAGYKTVTSIMDAIKRCGIPVKTLPSMAELIDKNGLWKQLRNVETNELLGRPVLKFRREKDIQLLANEIENMVVMVTGAGGSIGSELCRQIAQRKPKLLVLYERSETPLYLLELELKRKFPQCTLLSIIGDISNEEKLNKVMVCFKINLIYHAAAYKHVPMMERDPIEAIRNNILAVRKIAQVAKKNNVEKFIYISTDKAVNPTSIMGATKRVGELIMQALDGNKTKFIAVRFGNVIGSNGSVIPLFKEQIEHGGPITITHPETSRYFMAISEAVQLVMSAAAMGEGGEIFLLDMGEPIKISDMATKLIKSSGLKPGKDIEIKYIGLRPGEKLHEELYWLGENIVQTPNKKITMLKTTTVTKECLFSQISSLEKLVQANSNKKLLDILKNLIPESNLNSDNGSNNGNGSRNHMFRGGLKKRVGNVVDSGTMEGVRG